MEAVEPAGTQIASHLKYIAVGANRQSQCADWNAATGLLAFGAATNVALWMPMVRFLSRTSLNVAYFVDRTTRALVYRRFSLAMRRPSMPFESYNRTVDQS